MIQTLNYEYQYDASKKEEKKEINNYWFYKSTKTLLNHLGY